MYWSFDAVKYFTTDYIFRKSFKSTRDDLWPIGNPNAETIRADTDSCFCMRSLLVCMTYLIWTPSFPFYFLLSASSQSWSPECRSAFSGPLLFDSSLEPAFTLLASSWAWRSAATAYNELNSELSWYMIFPGRKNSSLNALTVSYFIPSFFLCFTAYLATF